MHKQKGKYFSAGGKGQRKCTSKRGSTSQQEGWGSGNFSFGDYTGKQELGGIRVHLEVRTSSADFLGAVRGASGGLLLTPFSSGGEGERPNSEIRTIVLP